LSRDALTPFSYVVLTLVGTGGAGPHDIVRMMRQGRVYWAAAESHYYAEPKRLEKLGYLRSEKQPGKTGQRTHYGLTDTGLGALRAWAPTPAAFPRIQEEMIVRVLAGDLVGDHAILTSLKGLRADLTELSRRLDDAEHSAQQLPHRARYLHLVHSLGRKLLQAHQEWADQIEHELQQRRHEDSPDKNTT
jgi:DNA-binding PadR family transcriptional regulator